MAELTKEEKGMRMAFMQIFPNLPLHYYSYIISKVDRKYLTGFFSFFSNWWAFHGMYYPKNFNEQSFYNIVNLKYQDYLKAIDNKHLEEQTKFIHDDDMLDKVIDEFWDNFKIDYSHETPNK